MSNVFKRVEAMYQKIERLTLVVVITARKFRPYFQEHYVMVKTNYPIRQVLEKLGLTGMMMSCSMELSKYDIQYIPIGGIKLQILADFLAEFSSPVGEEAPHSHNYNTDNYIHLKDAIERIIKRGWLSEHVKGENEIEINCLKVSLP